MRMSTSRTLALALGAGLTAPALAGGSAENAVLIINPSSIDSMYLGNYYKAKRNIPDSNVLYIDPNVANYAAFSANDGVLDGFLGFLANARIDDHTDFVVVTPGNNFFISAPNYITDGCSAVSRFSMSSAFGMAFLEADILGTPKKSSQYLNGYYSTSNTALTAFDSNTAWLSGNPSTAAGARRYFIGAMLGYNGANTGNSLSEMLTMIDRSVASDGTRPAGTFYFMNNTADAARNVRQPQFSAAITAITNAGGSAVQLNGTLPLTHHDCLGIISGFASETIDGADFTLIPGAFADHMTSWAATFDNGAQTKVSAWIRKGASASFGEVQEPCNYTGKFPNAKIQYFYFAGMSLGEAWYRSAQYVPFQGLFYGDPLTRAFTHIPSVSVAGVPVTPVSGYLSLTPSATTTHPTATIASYDLFIDGVLRASAAPGGTLDFDTALLDDGWHDLRVLAYDSTVTRSSGRYVGSFVTSNSGRSATISSTFSAGNLTRDYQFDVGGSGGGVGEARVLVNNRVVASRTGAGPLFVRGMAFGPGDHLVQSEVIFTDGRRARSPRVPLTVVYGSDAVSGVAPVAFSYTKYIENAGPAVVELPASFDNDPAGATYTLLSNPASASVGGGVTRAFRVITPTGSPCGSDSFTFNVTTASGTSGTATVTLVYLPPYRPCPADFDGNGFVNGDDFDAFTAAFDAGTAGADLNNDCFTNGDDFDYFTERFDRGC